MIRFYAYLRERNENRELYEGGITMEGKYDGFDFDRVGVKAYDDYNLPKLTVKISSTIIRTDNPDPNSWVKKFWRNE